MNTLTREAVASLLNDLFEQAEATTRLKDL